MQKRLVTCAAAFLLVTACAKKEPASAEAASQAVTIVPVVSATESQLSSDLTLTGEFIPYQEIDVMAKQAGYIKAIYVDIGDRVKSGQHLADLDIPEMQDDLTRAAAAIEFSESEIASATSNLARAQSASDLANLSFQRITDVSTKEVGLVPRQEVDEAKARQLGAAAQVAAAQSNLEATKRKLAMSRAEQARWKTLEKYSVISAPFTGVITKRYANTGAMIQQGTASASQAMPVVRLSQNNLLRLVLPVPESVVPSIRVGEPVEVEVESLQRTFSGRVTRFEGRVSMATRTMNTEVDVENPNYILVPGMYAKVNLHVSQNRKVLAVPVDAIEEVDGKPLVYSVQEGTIHVKPVVVGLKTSRQQEIRSGIEAGDLVIVGRHAGLENGQKVQPKIVHYDDPSKS